jgi:hypothetical protein
MLSVRSAFPYLNIGCGSTFDPRWTNLDLYSPSPHVINVDIAYGIPFAENTFAVAYHAHVLEQVGFHDVLVVDSHHKQIAYWANYQLDVTASGILPRPISPFIEATK